jgi:peptide-methionine (R)-S-oxide reductase
VPQPAASAVPAGDSAPSGPRRRRRAALYLLAAGRFGAGAAGLVRPADLPRLLGVDRVSAERTAWIVRMAAARDLALAAGLIVALRNRDGSERGWLVAGALADAVDAAALGRAAAARQVAAVPAAGAAALALGGAATAVRHAGASVRRTRWSR